MDEDTYNRKPLSLDEVCELLSGLYTPWWIAGGRAIYCKSDARPARMEIPRCRSCAGIRQKSRNIFPIGTCRRHMTGALNRG